MKVSLCTFNHTVGARSLFDMRHFLLDGFRGLGHDITFSERIEPDRLAIVFDYLPPEIGKKLLAANVEFVIIATEIPTKHPDSGAFQFNWRSDLDWGIRAAGFAQIAPKAKAILSMDPRPESLDAYRQFGVPVAALGVGYSPSLHAEMQKWNPEVDLDFAFTGVETEYRVGVIDGIRKKAVVGYHPGLLSFEARNVMIRRARCNLALRLTSEWPLPSFTRVMSLLHAERAALADTPLFSSPPAEMIPQVEIADLVRDPQGLLSASMAIDPMRTLEQLKDERPAAKVVGEAWQVLG